MPVLRLGDGRFVCPLMGRKLRLAKENGLPEERFVKGDFIFFRKKLCLVCLHVLKASHAATAMDGQEIHQG